MIQVRSKIQVISGIDKGKTGTVLRQFPNGSLEVTIHDVEINRYFNRFIHVNEVKLKEEEVK